MLLLNDFYTLTDLQKNDNTIKALVDVNADHKIFVGHFPGQPVMPGVCMVQITKEIVENILGCSTRLTTAGQIKFLTFIDPQINKLVDVQIQYTLTDVSIITVSSTFSYGDITYFKFKGILQIVG